MSKKVFLFGHTGSQNRGCEAIIRSTISLIKKMVDDKVILVTSNDEYDVKFGLDKICRIKKIGTAKKSLVQHALCAFERIVFKQFLYSEYLSQRAVLSDVSKGDLVFIVGGDTYCYDAPPISCYATNIMAKKKGATTVLWACSLEKSKIDKKMIADFENYDYIVPREIETYQLLMELGLKNPKILLGSDPAFHLGVISNHEALFEGRRFIGINVSPIAYKNDLARANFINCVNSILDNTEYSVLLIPHVYTKGKLDADVLKNLYEAVEKQEKVFLVDEELSCEQLKFLISKCEAFIGCRTHSTIAAYSTIVPTLVVGYSVKAKGIAEDLFQTSEGYVMMYDNLKRADELTGAFYNIWENKENIRTRLEGLMDEYKQRSFDALKHIFS